LGSASKSIFLQYFNWVIKGHLLDFEIENIVSLLYKGIKGRFGSLIIDTTAIIKITWGVYYLGGLVLGGDDYRMTLDGISEH
jgi:hypothetical protein